MYEKSKDINNTLSEEELALVKEYTLFVYDGYCTVRRTQQFWSGTITDMVIEQALMRLIKVNGGLVGRGIPTVQQSNF